MKLILILFFIISGLFYTKTTSGQVFNHLQNVSETATSNYAFFYDFSYADEEDNSGIHLKGKENIKTVSPALFSLISDQTTEKGLCGKVFKPPCFI